MNKLQKANVEDILGLSPMQEGMLFHYISDNSQDMYFEQYSYMISGDIGFDIFKKAWEYVVKCNETLRAVFRWRDVSKPVQIILKDNYPNITYHDLLEIEEKQKETDIESIKRNDRANKFDLEKEAALRINLIRVMNCEYIMIVSNHHILFDGWSNGIILKEFIQAYDLLAKGKVPPVMAKAGFKNYLRWQQSLDEEKSLAYWKSYLDGYIPQKLLPTDMNFTSAENSKKESIKSNLSPEMSDKIEVKAKELGITPVIIFAAAWGILLQLYNDRTDIVYGMTVSGRTPEVKGNDNMVGLFINTIPVRMQSIMNTDIDTILCNLNREFYERQEYESASLAKVITRRDRGYNEELFDTLFVYENYPVDNMVRGGGALSVKSFSGYGSTNYKLTLAVNYFEGFEINLIYSGGLFEEVTIELLMRRLEMLLAELTKHQKGKLGELELYIPEERELRSINSIEFDYSIAGEA